MWFYQSRFANRDTFELPSLDFMNGLKQNQGAKKPGF